MPKFDFKVIDEWCNRIAEHEAGWANYSRESHIEPLVLFYEDIAACNRSTAERVVKFLDLPFPQLWKSRCPRLKGKLIGLQWHDEK